jgi:hypothetical protein
VSRTKTKLPVDQHQRGLCHIEAPGCIVNIYHSLTDTEGRSVTRVDIRADQYAGEPKWTLPDVPEPSEAQIKRLWSILPDFTLADTGRLLREVFAMGADRHFVGVRVRQEATDAR